VPIDQLASLAVEDASPTSALGRDVGSADLDADGRADWIIGDPDADVAGRAYLVYGGLEADNCPGLSNPAQTDGDGDGAGDACDRCPLAADPQQRDLGRVASAADPGGAAPDGIGDACQCSDVSGDGRGTAADLAAIRRALAGTAALAEPAKCNVRGPLDAAPRPSGLRGDCSIADAAVLARQLAGLAPGVMQACAPALGF
jgi:hypothetical protein